MNVTWGGVDDLFIIVLTGMIAVMFLFIIMLWLRVRKMRKRYLHMMVSPNIGNLEDAIIELQERIQKLELQNKTIEQTIAAQWARINKLKANVGFVRFHAYEQYGSPLSFSIAVIDEQKTGFVITGIHGREYTHMYAKSLNKGKADIVLSPEEEKAIEIAYSSFKTGME